MTADLFVVADALVVGIEGARGDQAGDPGGDTVYGIARNFHPDEPWPPSWARAQEIRRQGYWQAQHCDVLPWAWALEIYDCAINQPGALKGLQAILGLAQDGVVGPITAVRIARASPDEFLRFVAERGYRYSKQPLWDTDAHGWLARLLTIHHAALLPPA